MAAALGISVNQLCLEAGINPRTIEYWKTKNPKSIETFDKIRATYIKKCSSDHTK
jgi:hypothetical protein